MKINQSINDTIRNRDIDQRSYEKNSKQVGWGGRTF